MDELFEYLAKEHGVNLLESDLQEVRRLVLKSLIKPVEKDNLPIESVIAYSEFHKAYGTLYLHNNGVSCLDLDGIAYYMEIPDIETI